MIKRVAYLSIHTSPLARPGSGDAGGMNVYMHELARTMARRGVEVDVFTRRLDPDSPAEVEVAPGYRVITIDAGPPGPIPAGDPGEIVGRFAEGVITKALRCRVRYDVIHSHYWLSGWAGLLLHEVLGVPLAISFHTLGRVKDARRRAGEASAGLLRIAAETDLIARAGCVIASTPAEMEELIEHYGADPGRLCVNPPGVDHEVFHPGDRAAAREALGIGNGPLILFVGRIQPLKGADLAIDAFARLAGEIPGARLLLLGGPSGPDGEAEVESLGKAVAGLGLTDRVEMRDPLPHHRMADAYRAADVLLVPSRSESFGLVAVEAQACGLPVVAARVGGLAYAVADGVSGFLVGEWDPDAYAAALRPILTDPAERERLVAGAIANAAEFSWKGAADRLLELYSGISGS